MNNLNNKIDRQLIRHLSSQLDSKIERKLSSQLWSHLYNQLCSKIERERNGQVKIQLETNTRL